MKEDFTDWRPPRFQRVEADHLHTPSARRQTRVPNNKLHPLLGAQHNKLKWQPPQHLLKSTSVYNGSVLPMSSTGTPSSPKEDSTAEMTSSTSWSPISMTWPRVSQNARLQRIGSTLECDTSSGLSPRCIGARITNAPPRSPTLPISPTRTYLKKLYKCPYKGHYSGRTTQIRLTQSAKQQILEHSRTRKIAQLGTSICQLFIYDTWCERHTTILCGTH